MNAPPPKKGAANKSKKEPKKEEVKLDDLNKVNLYLEDENENNKPMFIRTMSGIAKIENLEFPDDFPVGRYTMFIRNVDEIFDSKIKEISFDIVINPVGGSDDKKKKKK